MSFSEQVGHSFDQLTSVMMELCDSQYLNLGYSPKKGTSLIQAQKNFVEVFGLFSKLNKKSRVIDVGCGTGEQDLYYSAQHHCRQITGINISKVQIKLAREKAAKAGKEPPAVQFQWGDAMKMKDLEEGICDRVLALECSHLFDDIRAFFSGAHHVLNKGGYLCIAEVIPNYLFDYDPESLRSIQQETFAKFKSKDYADALKERGAAYLADLKRLSDSKKMWYITYDQYLKILGSEGFTVEETQDITEAVFKNFPIDWVAKRIVQMLRKLPIYHPRRPVLLSFLASAYVFKYYAYPTGWLGFYMIRAKRR